MSEPIWKWPKRDDPHERFLQLRSALQEIDIQMKVARFVFEDMNRIEFYQAIAFVLHSELRDVEAVINAQSISG